MLERVERRYWVRPTRFPDGERFVFVYDRATSLPVPWVTRYSLVFHRTREGS